MSLLWAGTGSGEEATTLLPLVTVIVNWVA